jgi:hypothetical protein
LIGWKRRWKKKRKGLERRRRREEIQWKVPWPSCPVGLPGTPAIHSAGRAVMMEVGTLEIHWVGRTVRNEVGRTVRKDPEREGPGRGIRRALLPNLPSSSCSASGFGSEVGDDGAGEETPAGV